MNQHKLPILCTAVPAGSLNAIPQTANFHQSVIYIKNCLQILNDRKNENTLVRTKRYRRRPVKRTAGCGKELQKIAFTFTLCPPWDSQPVLRVNKPNPVMEENGFFRGHKSSDILNSLKWEWDRGVNSTSSRLVWWARLYVTWQLQSQIKCCSETIFGNFLSNEWLNAGSNFTH